MTFNAQYAARTLYLLWYAQQTPVEDIEMTGLELADWFDNAVEAREEAKEVQHGL